MKFSRKAFKVLEALNDREITTQRQLSEHTGISLGQVNYVVKSLIGKGLVKIGNFSKSKQKIGYAYLLTPKGIEAKSKLAVDYITSKLNEYIKIRQKIKKRLISAEQKGHNTFVFVGPDIVKEQVDSIIRDNNMGLPCIENHIKLAGLKIDEIDHGPFDFILVFDEDAAVT